jgi:hypothetical protein
MLTSNANLQNLLVVYSVCTSVLFLLVKFSNFFGANMEDHPPEDVVLGKQPPVPADIKRRMRIIMNNLENTPIELALFWAGYVAVLTQSLGGGGREEALALTVLLPVYTAARVGFVATYALALQPARTICFVLATTCALAAAGVLLSAASKAYAL